MLLWALLGLLFGRVMGNLLLGLLFGSLMGNLRLGLLLGSLMGNLLLGLLFGSLMGNLLLGLLFGSLLGLLRLGLLLVCWWPCGLVWGWLWSLLCCFSGWACFSLWLLVLCIRRDNRPEQHNQGSGICSSKEMHGNSSPLGRYCVGTQTASPP